MLNVLKERKPGQSECKRLEESRSQDAKAREAMKLSRFVIIQEDTTVVVYFETKMITEEK